MSHALEDDGEVDSVALLMKDRGWVAVQIKAFTSWLNQTIAHRPSIPQVEDIGKDLQSGITLINFFELLAGKKLREKWVNKQNLHRIEKIQNCALALGFMEKEMEVRNPGIGAEEIVDTNVKLILGLLYTLYRKYRIAVIEHSGTSAEEALLAWVKETTQSYDGVQVNMWRDSFQDGLTFLALTHAYNPETSGVDFKSYNKADRIKNLEAAFDFAEQELQIPKLLEADEVAEGTVDERSLVLYTSLFFHAFRALKEKEELERQARERESALEEEQRKKMQLESDNQMLWEMIEKLNTQIAEATVERDNLKERSKKFNKMIESLKTKDEDIAAEKEKLRKEIEEFEKRVKELKDRLANELSSMSESEKELSNKLSDAVSKVSSLQQLQTQLEMDIENYQNQIGDLTSDLEKERENRNAREKEVEHNAYRNGVMVDGLDVLKINLDRHLDDLHRWKEYIEYNKDADIDFSVKDYSNPWKNSDFLKQLEDLSGDLIKENVEMLKILQAREEDFQRKEEEKRKKEEKKKQKQQQAKKSKK